MLLRSGTVGKARPCLTLGLKLSPALTCLMCNIHHWCRACMQERLSLLSDLLSCCSSALRAGESDSEAAAALAAPAKLRDLLTGGPAGNTASM